MRLGICCAYENSEAVRVAGYDYIQPALCDIAYMSEADFRAALRFMDSSELAAEAMNSFFSPKSPSVVGQSVDFAGISGYAEYALYRASAMGCRTAVLDNGAVRRVTAGFSPRTAADQFVEVLQICAKAGARYGISIAVQPLCAEQTNFINTLDEAMKLAERSGMSNVGIAADILHMQRAGEKLTRLRDCKTKLLHVHIRNPITGEMPAPSDGFDYRGLRTVLTQSGYNGRCSLNGRLVGSVGEIAANAAAAGIPIKG